MDAVTGQVIVADEGWSLMSPTSLFKRAQTQMVPDGSAQP
jgi:hypothetical protein